jgi:hypothetical protein
MVVITFAEAKVIVRAAEESTWTQGTYTIEPDGFEDEIHYLVVRGPAEDDLVEIDSDVPLVNKQTGAIEYVLPHLPEVVERLDAMTPVSGGELPS